MSTCPRCQTSLTSADYEGVAVETCGRCNGQWLNAARLKEIVDTREKTWAPADLEAMRRRRLRGVAVEQAQENLPCPTCGVTMAAFNYGGDSGIILDKCWQCGGIWLDGGELEKVQMAVEGSELDLDRDIKRFTALSRLVSAFEDRVDRGEVSPSPLSPSPSPPKI